MTVEVLTDVKVEIHFHYQDRVAVLIESAGGVDEKLGELTLFAAYACRQMVNLGGSPPAHSLANLLIECSGGLQELTGHRNPDGVRLVEYAGSPGRKRFEARLRMADGQHSFTMNAKGFGLFGQGLGYYAPTSVTMLLQHLVERRLLDEEYLAALAITAKTCGETFLNGRLTVATQDKIALSAAMLGPTAIEHAKATAKESKAIETDLEEGSDDPVVALLQQNGANISVEDWLDIFTEGGTPVMFRDLDAGMKLAFHSLVVKQSDRFRETCPEAVPDDAEVLVRDVGGYVMNGYVIGRHLLGTQVDDYSSLIGEGAGLTAARILQEFGTTPHKVFSEGGEGLDAFMSVWLEPQANEGVYGRIADRKKARMYLFMPILDGFGLAIAEHKVVSG